MFIQLKYQQSIHTCSCLQSIHTCSCIHTCSLEIKLNSMYIKSKSIWEGQRIEYNLIGPFRLIFIQLKYQWYIKYQISFHWPFQAYDHLCIRFISTKHVLNLHSSNCFFTVWQLHTPPKRTMREKNVKFLHPPPLAPCSALQ